MSGRRGYYRYGVVNAGGRLRVVRDVTVWRGSEGELQVISEEPESSGSQLTLEHVVDGAVVTTEVSVIDCQPTVVNGLLRHRLRVRLNDSAGDREDGRPVRVH